MCIGGTKMLAAPRPSREGSPGEGQNDGLWQRSVDARFASTTCRQVDAGTVQQQGFCRGWARIVTCIADDRPPEMRQMDPCLVTMAAAESNHERKPQRCDGIVREAGGD